MAKLSRPGLLLALAMVLVGCQTQPMGPCHLDLRPAAYKDLPGWKEDKTLKALPAIKRSCAAILKKDPSVPMATSADKGGTASDWHPFCYQILEEPLKRNRP